MATQEENNIKQEYNTATIGLNMDQSLNQLKKGCLTYALNAAMENFDANGISYQNEEGTEFCLTFPEDYVLIGTHFINEQNKHIFFLTVPNEENSEIGYMDNNDCLYHTLINASCLNFNIHHPIQKVVHKITNCSTEIYWTDGYNSRRYLDIDNIPKILKYNSSFCDPIYTNEIDCNQLKLQPNFLTPQLDVTDVVSGGNLLAGTYQFAVQYSDASGNPYTSYQSITNPTPIADINITTVNFNYPVGKSIIVDVTNLDNTGQFQYFNLAVIKTINAITSVELVGTYYIDGISQQITYTGQDVTAIRLSINDIFETFPYYDIAEDVTNVQDVLVWKGLTSIDRINYQQIASQITLQWETWRIPSTENYATEENATNFRGYLRDEIYPFEIVFILSNGKETDSFHIPGRIKNSNETHADIPDTNDDFIGNPDYTSGGIGYSPYWKIYNTASVTGYCPEYITDILYKGAYQYGEFAYWESTEEYPCNKEVWGELSGQKVRHHKFPDVLVSPIYESKLFVGSNSMVMGNDAVFPIGIKVDVQQIESIINSSTLSSSQKEEIVGFKIVRGDRSVNKSIVAKGILRNVGKYERDGEEFYYPNYPYNDLTEDPFINSTNNAYSQICETYDINITQLTTDPLGIKDYADLEYTDCITNKRNVKRILKDELLVFEQCSTTRPTILSPSEGTVGIATYEMWTVYATPPFISLPTWQPPLVAWVDPIEGSKQDHILVAILNVVSGTGAPVKVSGSGTIDANYSNTHYPSNACNNSDSPIAIKDDATLKYRQIFNSPETSFGQPFLGTILKLENIIFGKGEAHFTEVKNNAKYKLISEEAQKLALKSSEDLAGGLFDATAMFTAYQSYLTIYINGITRRNYAYSFNSIADYNYSTDVPNDAGIKQRTIDIARYLIPGVQAIGNATDDYPINNYQRESSVFIKTDVDKSAIPYPTAPVIDESRFTISEKLNCTTPAKKEPISVVSYYASLKNNIINQWGQIYSYNTVDTGFQRLFNIPSQYNVVFGGDTFISRFAFKTKLPFFIDNRVGAPDDSDIFYDEIGNIAYPKYWHSARSILKDYNISGIGALSNIISYKAHNFDCPNDAPYTTGVTTTSLLTTTTTTTSIDSVTTNSSLTYYDGYFYLFAYGIPNFYCESSYNTDLRQAFNNKEGDFWPHVSSSIPDDWVQESFVSIANDNTYTYNTTFSKQNKENTFTHLPVDWNNTCYTYYPFRAIYSDVQNTDAGNRVNSWLIYRAVSYFDFPQNYGNLTSLDGIQNKAILARFENKSLLYNNLLTIDTSNPQAAYVGNPVMFKNPPIDFAETDLGYVGSQHKMLLKIPQGQITIDAKRGQVFLISGTDVVDLSAVGSGMNRFFTDHLAFEILRYFPEVDVDNAFTSIGLHGVYDSKYDRIIITKLDYIPHSDDIIYDSITQLFYQEEIINNVTIRTRVYLTDLDFFCNKSWTLSYNMTTKSWISFHSYIPNWYIAENNFFYSGLNGCCDEFDFIAGVIDNTLDCTLEGEAYVRITTTTTSTTVIPTTTTTTSSSTTTSTSSTTTTTTTYIPDCSLDAIAHEDSDYTTTTSTSSTTTTTTTCIIPEGLNEGRIVGSHYNYEDPTWIFYNVSVEAACEAHSVFYDSIVGGGVGVMDIQYGLFQVGELMYLNYGGCELAPTGYFWFQPDMTSVITYFQTNNSIYIVTIVDGVITAIDICDYTPCYLIGIAHEAVTTTTSTTPLPTTTTTTSTSSTTTTTTTLTPTTTTTTTLLVCNLELEIIDPPPPE